MSTTELKHVALSRQDDIVLIQVTTRGFHAPDAARELSSELERIVGQDWAQKLLVNCDRISFLSSTAFAALVKLVRLCKSSGKQVRFCAMAPEILLGAQIIGLDRLAMIDEKEATAIASFSGA
jgi:anti-sigma B factor antagonist